MAAYLRLTVLWTALGLFGCSGEGTDAMSFIQVNSAEITSGKRITFGTGQPDVSFAWTVSYTNPTSVYAMEVLLADAEGNQQPLFHKECSRREERKYGCGKTGEQVCSPDAEGLYCNGQHARVDRQYDLLLFKGCVNDYYNQPVCHIQQLPVELVGVIIAETPSAAPDNPSDGSEGGTEGDTPGTDTPGGGDNPGYGDPGGNPNDGDNPGDGDPGNHPDDGGAGGDNPGNGDPGDDDGSDGDNPGNGGPGGNPDDGGSNGDSPGSGDPDDGEGDGDIGEDEGPGRNDNFPIIIDPNGWLGLPPAVPAI